MKLERSIRDFSIPIHFDVRKKTILENLGKKNTNKGLEIGGLDNLTCAVNANDWFSRQSFDQ